MAENDTDKTEDPTPERRRKAREEGQFPRARDAGNMLGSFAVMLTLFSFGDDLALSFREFAVRCYGEPYTLVRGDVRALFGQVSHILMLLVFPVAIAAALGATAAGLFEAGFHPNMDLASPRWSRVDPLARLKQMFALRDAAINVTLQLARVVMVACVVYFSIKSAFPRLVGLGRGDLTGASFGLLDAVSRLALWGSMALFVITAVDYWNSRRRHEQSIRMSRQEVKDEHRQHEGDPRVRSRQRARAREMARRGLAKAVRAADFVIANPTHISVAVRYRVEEGAPVVSAKGYDEVALYIRTIAKEHKIPVIENRPLARALAKRVKVGRAIPVDLYAAVAQVLAFVYRLKNKTLDVRRPTPRGPGRHNG
jgi:flagellar biosynthetic protein FlhB